MYKALKSAQNEIQESLLKFADEVSAFDKKVQNQCSRGDPCRCAFLTQGVSSPIVQKQAQDNDNTEMVDMLQKTLQYMIEKQNSQYAVLVNGIQELNVSLKNIANILITQNDRQEQVITSSIIPNIQPVSQDSDLKTVCVLGMEDSDIDESQDDLNTAVDLESVNEAHVDIEDEEQEVEEEVEEEEEQDTHPTDVTSATNAEEQEEEIELEEWTYKGRVFFKDSNNTVYANNSGEIGDPIGQYDSVKNIVRPLKN
jgi:hypothetical protein